MRNVEKEEGDWLQTSHLQLLDFRTAFLQARKPGSYKIKFSFANHFALTSFFHNISEGKRRSELLTLMWKFHTAIASLHLQKLVSSNCAWPLALNLLTVPVAFFNILGIKLQCLQSFF